MADPKVIDAHPVLPLRQQEENEGDLLRWFSDQLTGGAAGTWDEIKHALESRVVPVTTLREYVQHKTECVMEIPPMFRHAHETACTCGLDKALAASPVIPLRALEGLREQMEQWRKGYEYSEDTPLHRQHYWDGYNNGRRECAIQLDALLVSTRPTAIDAHGLVRNLLSRLPYPDRLPCPEVLIEDDGDLCFDWDARRDATVSASLTADGWVRWAALVGDWKAHGTFQLPSWSDEFNEALTRLGEALDSSVVSTRRDQPAQEVIR